MQALVWHKRAELKTLINLAEVHGMGHSMPLAVTAEILSQKALKGDHYNIALAEKKLIKF